jgi:hypothetical protein
MKHVPTFTPFCMVAQVHKSYKVTTPDLMICDVHRYINSVTYV